MARKRKLHYAGNLTAVQLKTAIQSVGLTISEYGRAVGISPRTLQAYTAGRRGVPGDLSRKVRKLERAVQRRADTWLDVIERHPPSEVIQFDMAGKRGTNRKLRMAAMTRVILKLDSDREYEVKN